jgi:hypothetical protein
MSLGITVIFTSESFAAAALRAAASLARRLDARVTLLMPEVVPFPVPLDSPALDRRWNEARLQSIAQMSRVATTVHVRLCRDRWELLTDELRPRSLVVVAGRRRTWWRTGEESLARRLSRAGHEVVFVEAA